MPLKGLMQDKIKFVNSPVIVYFAAPLFTQAEWNWNELLSRRLEELKLKIILPQERARPMLSGTATFSAKQLFRGNVGDIGKANVILAVLDQADPDSGTCWECGYAYKLGIPIIGLKTDIRGASDAPGVRTNLMLDCCCSQFIQVPLSRRNDVDWVAQMVEKAISRQFERRA